MTAVAGTSLVTVATLKRCCRSLRNVECNLRERPPCNLSQWSHQRHQLRLLSPCDGSVVGESPRLGDQEGLHLFEIGLYSHEHCSVHSLNDSSSEGSEAALLAFVLRDVEGIQGLVHGLLVLFTIVCLSSVVENALQNRAGPKHEDTPRPAPLCPTSSCPESPVVYPGLRLDMYRIFNCGLWTRTALIFVLLLFCLR